MEKIVIPVAGGKGGTGKTFFTANLAISLARMGHQTVAVDLDLGGSNLHSFFGLSNQYPGVGDFLKARNAELEELLVSTETPNLKFLPGDGRTPFMANVPYAQKMRLISHLMNLPAKYILLDLGAGSSFNTLDFFRISHNGFLITTPEYPAIMNLLAFLKLFLFRAIERMFVKDQIIQDLMHSTYKQPMTDQQTSIGTLREQIRAVDPEAGEQIAALCSNYRPRIVFNMGEHPDELKIAERISDSLDKLLSMKADYFGFIFYDTSVRQSIKKRVPLLPHYQESIAAKSLQAVTERLVKYLDRPVENSAQMLLSRTWEVYNNRA